MSTIGAALARLKAAYPREPFAAATERVYAEDLSDLDDQAVYDAVVRLTRTSTWRPTIAAIRIDVAEHETGLPSAEVAWDMALAADPNMPAEVRAALAASGGQWSLRYTENPTTARAQFVKDYEARRAATVRALAAGNGYRQLLPPPTPVASLNGRRTAQIPVTSRVRPRPVMFRLAHRYAGRMVGPPTEEQKQDAIVLLREGPQVEDDPLFAEAQRIMDDASAA
jgi:hypothetical protein